MPLGVLDLVPISSGESVADSLRNTLDLARHADRLGYHRYLGHRAPPGPEHRRVVVDAFITTRWPKGEVLPAF
ncbi:hypothetical protein CC117_14050 [Parafrankia colletiae]|uniref:Uncharacterized protein n=1 Tax=Parafrankia colletiae TaxID=573497 RepID=A0A1S1R4S4_9ACTN|nr:hypothetical protein CC117_14050 [Parafrankia colletiae]